WFATSRSSRGSKTTTPFVQRFRQLLLGSARLAASPWPTVHTLYACSNFTPATKGGIGRQQRARSIARHFAQEAPESPLGEHGQYIRQVEHRKQVERALGQPDPPGGHQDEQAEAL